MTNLFVGSACSREWDSVFMFHHHRLGNYHDQMTQISFHDHEMIVYDAPLDSPFMAEDRLYRYFITNLLRYPFIGYVFRKIAKNC